MQKILIGLGVLGGLAVLSIIFLFATAGLQFPKRLSYNSPPPVIRLGNDFYQFPWETKDGPYGSKWPGAVNLRLHFPDMRGTTPENWNEMHQTGQKNPTLQILLDDPNHPDVQSSMKATPTAVMWRIVDLFLNENVLMERKNNNTAELLQDFNSSVTLNLTELRLKPDANSKNSARRTAMLKFGARYFLQIENQKIETILDCDGPKQHRNPHCTLYFPYRDIVVKAHFVMSLTANWYQIKSGLTNFLEKTDFRNRGN